MTKQAAAHITKLRADVAALRLTIATFDRAEVHYRSRPGAINALHANTAKANAARARAELDVVVGEIESIIAIYDPSRD